MKDRARDLAEQACELLQRAARELLARRGGSHLVETNGRALDLRLALPWSHDRAEVERFALAVEGAIDAQIGDELERAAAFRPGHVFCHRCEATACDHSRPPTSRHVFVGYAQTGTPRYLDFAQLCLDRRHPRVDALYDDPPAFVTLVNEGAELHRRMLREFTHPGYELQGQVVAGFFRVRPGARGGRGIVALTLQAATWRSPRGRIRVGLNVLGRAPAGEDLAALWTSHQDLPWHDPVQWAQTALSSLASTWDRAAERHGAPPADVPLRVRNVLNGLARRLEREQRARGRRTRHAEQRHSSGERPTGKAVDDARRADREHCLVDEQADTLVVLGERGRTHFFTRDGQHVSSARYSREAIARRIQRERWRAASAEEYEVLLRGLARDVP